MILIKRYHVGIYKHRRSILVLMKRSYASEATFATDDYKMYLMEESPSTTVTLTKEDAVKYYEQMMIIRRMENVMASMYKEKVIRGFCHLYAGQEAVAVGIHANLIPQDTAITSYRAHGWTWIMGEPVLGVIGELAGRKSGCSRGKGGSMHTYARNFYGGNGIVGAPVPLGVGQAFYHKYTNSGGVSVTLYGDGASNQGQVAEAFNISALWKLPVLYVCENNQYGMGTATKRAAAETDFYKRGCYIPGIWVNGMDILAVREAVRFAFQYIRAGNGPIVMEAFTYRYFGHSMSDPGTSYRSREEIQEMRQKRDPINMFKDKIVAGELVKEDELKDINAKVKKEVDDAAAQAKVDPEPSVDELAADVYMKYDAKLRLVQPFSSVAHRNIASVKSKF